MRKKVTKKDSIFMCSKIQTKKTAFLYTLESIKNLFSLLKFYKNKNMKKKAHKQTCA